MIKKIILASISGVRKKILDENGISSEVIHANIDEDQIKEALIKEKATQQIITKKAWWSAPLENPSIVNAS